jgi:stage V sporulation protein D (sporulation-specific penicillin-binding protein)
LSRIAVSNITVKKRLIFLFILMTFMVGALMGRLFYVQLVIAEELQAKAWEQWNRSIPARSPRGSIYDRKDRLLASSASAESIIAIPPQISDKEEAARLLAPVIGMDEENLFELLSKKSASVYIKRLVEDEVAREVRKLGIKGISFSQETKRFYPHGSLASQLIGFVGIDEGLSGLEHYYELTLKGRDGRIEFQSDAKGRQIPQGVQSYIKPKDGNDLVLTIDQTIQYIMEREMERVMLGSKPKSIIAIAVDPQSGEVLGIAGKPDYDPNRFADFPQELWKLPPVTNTFEPGSTYKLVTLSAAIEEGKYRANEGFYCGGSILVAGHSIGCWTRGRGGHGSIDFTEVVLGSCNPGFITLGNRIGSDKLLQYINAFGFGARTGIDVPGEGTGLIFTDKQFGPLEAATSSFGQGVSVTPIQQIMAVAAIANGGYLMKPYIVSEIRDSEGNVLEKKEPQVVRRILSAETTREVTRIMELVVTEGSGMNAYIEGYRIAGKTGTAQKVGPGGVYIGGEYILSFVGFAPAEDPQIVLYIAVDAPQAGPQWGSQVSAPMFKRMMNDILNYLNVPSSQTQVNTQPKMVEVPDLVNLSLDDANDELERSGLLVKIIGSGGTILNQTPKPGAKVPLHTQILLYLGGGGEGQRNEVVVPDLTGKSMREAGEILGWLNLRMNFSGSGIAVSQEPAPYTLVAPNSIVNVEFRTDGEPAR